MNRLGFRLWPRPAGSDAPPAPAAQRQALLEQLRQARQGDREARERLIRQFVPLVVRTASRTCGRYVEWGRDDEVSVGLLALDEAIDSYDDSRGLSFPPFAETVIRRRLIDHIRRQAKVAEVPLSELEVEGEEGEVWSPAEVDHALRVHRDEEEARARREEIADYQAELAKFGIRFAELAELAPKHEDARQRAIEVARRVADNPLFRERLVSRRELPLAQLEAEVRQSRKTLERQRKYIIAVALILMGDFPHLRHFIGR